MPELPEVETIKRGLSKLIINQKIRKTTILCEKSFIGVSGKIEGARITALRRFGKALIIDLDNEKSLMIHLRMTGQLIYDGKERFAAGHPSENFVNELPNRQTRVFFELDKGTLYFNDQRKFGFIKLMDTEEVENDSFIEKLAKEPWQISADELYEKLQKHKNSPIKAAILDQTIIAGLGNIYADETLFMSKIHPAKKSGEITRKEVEDIIKNAKGIMDKSIASGGSTFETYVKPDGTRGDYLDNFAQVFNKTSQPCPRCGAKIKKIKVSGRGTHVCPNCQKEKI